jgi:hypothetical protein
VGESGVPRFTSNNPFFGELAIFFLFNDKITHVGNGEFIEWVDKKTGKKKRQAKWFADAFRNTKTGEERSRIRSKTFPGIAKAMAEQWGAL